jgi:hypothetical protein
MAHSIIAVYTQHLPPTMPQTFTITVEKTDSHHQRWFALRASFLNNKHPRPGAQ